MFVDVCGIWVVGIEVKSCEYFGCMGSCFFGGYVVCVIDEC